MINYGLMLSFASLTKIGLKYMDSIFLPHYKSLEIVGVFVIASFIATVIETPLNAL